MRSTGRTGLSISFGSINKKKCAIKADWTINAAGEQRLIIVRAIEYKRLQLLLRAQECRSMFSTIEDVDHFVPHIDFPAKKILANPANQLVI